MTKIAILIILKGWAMMVALGMLAGYLGIHTLAIGFWPAYALAVLLSLGFSTTGISRG